MLLGGRQSHEVSDDNDDGDGGVFGVVVGDDDGMTEK